MRGASSRVLAGLSAWRRAGAGAGVVQRTHGRSWASGLERAAAAPAVLISSWPHATLVSARATACAG